MMLLTGMPKGGRLPLDFFVIGESTPVFGGIVGGAGGLAANYFLRRVGLRMISSGATGVHPKSFNASSP